MPKIKVVDMSGKELREIEISEVLFASDINETAVHQAVVNHLANRRQGTQSTKTRSEVRGGGRKPWRQKGTGSARQGSTRSPQWKGGGVVFAPKPRDYSYKLPKSLKKVALSSALTSKFNDGKMIVVDNISFDAPKTSKMVEFFDKLGARKPLVVTESVDKNVYLSARNIEKAAVTYADLINVYELLKHDNLVISESALKRVEEVFN
ncbi:50S ribosomal protein L4 [Tissierellia bacterium S7-1-4]|uniref:50S ribosomal protein L4 n=1 Tax=Ezakiella coagulans TaxID=46507 RepID=UPI00050DB7B0|nr:50S ribosomal protein L4 [Ezakiella coagulans]KGF06806.1 50S ribosomal protein L4 [Tissierellia bacterium S7-1-4]UQK61353.1 50S ribosomal protein L4 [Ezakiella coagulans]